MADFAARRQNMVESQIRTNKVTHPALIAAMEEVPREQFVPKAKQGVAYVDEDIAIAPGRALMEPMVLARLLQAAEIRPSDVVLDIGCGTGYSAAVLGRMANTVVALESNPELARQAIDLLTMLAIDNVAVVEGGLPEGYPKQAPYDAIVLEGMVPGIPDDISHQLADGGRLVAVVSDEQGIGRAALYTRRGGAMSHRQIFDAAVVPLPGFEVEPEFVF